MEWHPCLPGTVTPFGGPQTNVNDPTILLAACEAEMDLIVQYRPGLVAPFAWQLSTSPIEGAPFETALKDLVTKLELGRQSSAEVTVDAPANGATVAAPFTVTGYAADLGNRGPGRDAGIDSVQILAFKNGSGTAINLGAVQYGITRSDVAASLGTQFINSGFSVSGALLNPGQYRLDVIAHSTVDGTKTTKSITITIGTPTPDPHIGLDAPANGATLTAGASFTVRGWTIDKGASSGTGVDAVTTPPIADPVGFVRAIQTARGQEPGR